MPNVKATKALQKRSAAALESFHRYYTTIWGEDRWHESLFPALSQPTRYCALINRFATQSEVQQILADESDISAHEFRLPFALTSDETAVHHLLVVQSSTRQSFPSPRQVLSSQAGKQVLSHWNMDLASVLAACVLQARPGDRVLDLCAAPGGKSIVLAQILWSARQVDVSISDSESINYNPKSCLHSNESDFARYKRLVANMQSYLPARLLTDEAVKVVHIDGSDKSALQEIPLGLDGYDKILLDAPCSSERHIIHAHLKAASAGHVAEELANWKSSHAKTLAKTQAALLMTALRAAKLGGTVLYATCSISHEENDDVIERTMETIKRDRKRNAHSPQSAWKVKLDDSFESNPSGKQLLDSMTEPTRFGRIALPDHPAAGRWGPLYFCLLQKVPYKAKIEMPSTVQS